MSILESKGHIQFPWQVEKDFEKFLLRPPRKRVNILIRALFAFGVFLILIMEVFFK